MNNEIKISIAISADAEWSAVKNILENPQTRRSPYGEWFESSWKSASLIWFFGGWGKISAAASTQYAIDTWQPRIILNLGTCGGFSGIIEQGTTILVEKTIIYDIYDQMLEAEHAVQAYTTSLCLDWLGDHYPHPVKRGLLVSADRDLIPEEIPGLQEKYGAVAGDWESGSIAYVSARNQVPCLILRTVTDIVSRHGSPAYNNIHYFEEQSFNAMQRLLSDLPGWLDLCLASFGTKWR